MVRPQSARDEGEEGSLGWAAEAHGGHGGRAEAGGDVEPGALVLVEALDAGTVDAAVGGEGAVEGDADLAAVGMTGEEEVVAVGGKAVQVAGLWGVQDAQVDVSLGVNRAGDLVV